MRPIALAGLVLTGVLCAPVHAQRARAERPRAVAPLDSNGWFRGATWLATFGAGFGAFQLPIFIDHYRTIGSSYSRAATFGGYGVSGVGEFWPLHGDRIGFAVMADATVGLVAATPTANSDAGSLIGVGTKLYGGGERLAALAEFSIENRDASATSKYAIYDIDATSEGAATYSVTRFALGFRYGGVNTRHSEWLIFRDKPSYTPYRPEKSTGIGAHMRYFLGHTVLEAQYAPSYPISGRPYYPIAASESADGPYWALRFYAQVRTLGSPYFGREEDR